MQTEINRFDDFFKNYLKRGITGGAPWIKWNYKDDIIVIGAYKLFCATGDIFYRNIILDITKDKITKDDALCGKNLDEVSFAKTDMILESITGDNKFKKRKQIKLDALKIHPRTKTGNFWHKDIYPNQVWLDGLYMAMPVYIQDEKNIDDCIKQFENVHKLMYNKNTKLYAHAWDESKKEKWANKHTGLSPCVWCRAVGWFLMSLVDCYELITQKKQKDILKNIFQIAIAGVLEYEHNKMFYQLVDLKEEKNNYLETSGSAMIAYSLMKSSRLKMLDKCYFNKGVDILDSIAKIYLEKDILNGICGSAGLGAGPDNRTDRDGSIFYYLSEPIKPNNQHGVAACMMAYSEYLYCV